MVKLNTGLKLSAFVQLAQMETIKMTKYPRSLHYGVAGE
jgi:hypothetical protein